MKPNQRLVDALTPAAPRVLEGATVTAVGVGVATIDLLGTVIADVPVLGEAPAVDDVVTVIRSENRLLILTGGGGTSGAPITVSATAPASPSLNDLWVDIS